MAALEAIVNSGNVALLANTAKTVLQLTAPANHRIRVKGFSVTLAGTAPIDLTVRVVRQTTAGTGTTATPVKLDPGADETLQTSVTGNFTVEPTADAVLQFKRLQGSYEKMLPMGQEWIVPGNGRLGIECTATSAATVAVECSFEE